MVDQFIIDNPRQTQRPGPTHQTNQTPQLTADAAEAVVAVSEHLLAQAALPTLALVDRSARPPKGVSLTYLPVSTSIFCFGDAGKCPGLIFLRPISTN